MCLMYKILHQVALTPFCSLRIPNDLAIWTGFWLLVAMHIYILLMPAPFDVYSWNLCFCLNGATADGPCFSGRRRLGPPWMASILIGWLIDRGDTPSVQPKGLWYLALTPLLFPKGHGDPQSMNFLHIFGAIFPSNKGSKVFPRRHY